MPKRPAKKPPRKTARRTGNAGPALKPQQDKFVREYLVDLNATQAAIRAGYSPKTAESQASRLLRNVKVAAAVEEALEERQKRTEITQDRVLKELSRIAFSNITDYVLTDEGQVQLAEAAHPEAMRAVSSIKRKTRTFGTGEQTQTVHEVELKLWDKPNPLKLAGRHVGLFPNEVKVDMGEQTLAGILSAAHDLRNARRKAG